MLAACGSPAARSDVVRCERKVNSRMVPRAARPRLAPKFRMVWVMPVASPYERFPARFTASVLAGPSIHPIPAPATITQILCWSKDRDVTFEAQMPKPTAASAHPSTTARLAPCRSSMRPPTWAMTTKPMKKKSRKSPGLRRSLVQGDLCVLAGEEEDGDEGHHGDQQHDVLHRERTDPEDRDLNEGRRRPEFDQDEHADDRQADDDADPGPGVAPAPQR